MTLVIVFGVLFTLGLIGWGIFRVAKFLKQESTGNQQSGDNSQQSTSTTKPKASFLGKCLKFTVGVTLVMAVLYLVLNLATMELPTNSSRGAGPSAVPATVYVAENYTKEQKLAAIASCETDYCVGPGRMFETDGETPFRNREGVDAVCTYQIRESVWGAKAKELGKEYDFHTKEGCEKMANWIYDQDVKAGGKGTAAWETDSRGKERWQNKLLGTERTIYFAETKEGVWSEPTPVPISSAGTWVYWETVNGKPYKVRINKDDKLVFASVDAIPSNIVSKELEFSGDGARMRVFLSFKKV